MICYCGLQCIICKSQGIRARNRVKCTADPVSLQTDWPRFQSTWYCKYTYVAGERPQKVVLRSGALIDAMLRKILRASCILAQNDQPEDYSSPGQSAGQLHCEQARTPVGAGRNSNAYDATSSIGCWKSNEQSTAPAEQPCAGGREVGHLSTSNTYKTSCCEFRTSSHGPGDSGSRRDLNPARFLNDNHGPRTLGALLKVSNRWRNSDVELAPFPTVPWDATREQQHAEVFDSNTAPDSRFTAIRGSLLDFDSFEEAMDVADSPRVPIHPYQQQEYTTGELVVSSEHMPPMLAAESLWSLQVRHPMSACQHDCTANCPYAVKPVIASSRYYIIGHPACSACIGPTFHAVPMHRVHGLGMPMRDFVEESMQLGNRPLPDY